MTTPDTNAPNSAAGGGMEPGSEQPVSEQDMVNVRHTLHLLKTQLEIGQIDPPYMARQVTKVEQLLERLDGERKGASSEGRFEALYNVSRLIGSSLDLQTVLDQVMDAIIQLTGAERGFMMLRDDDGGLSVQAARNIDKETLDEASASYSRTIANEVIDTGKHIVTMNAAEDPRFAGQMSIVTQALRSIMATPLRARGAIIGVVYVDSRVSVGLFDKDDLAALDAFSGQAAVAIDNARLFSETDEELSNRVEELRQLRRIDLLINESLDIERTVEKTLESVCRVSDAQRSYLGMVENVRASADEFHVRQTHAYPPTAPTDTEDDVYLEERYPSISQVVRADEPRVVKTENTVVLIVPVHNEKQVVGVAVVERDGQEPFAEAQRDIVERVIARAAIAIANAGLYQAVQDADRAKSEFVGVVAHDLKVPMTSIMGYAELIRMGNENLTERQLEFVQKIVGTVKRMEILVSDLSDISRIESGHFFMDETRVTVNGIVQSVRDNTLTQIQERGHNFVTEIEPGLPDMWVDYYRLLQVLTNLVSNAYKYTENGGTITLKVASAGDRVRFSVSDTGIGMTQEQIEKLGEKFWRADDDFTRSQPGTGLGFSITRSLVEQMGSMIDIESTVGVGSTFSFSVARYTGQNA